MELMQQSAASRNICFIAGRDVAKNETQKGTVYLKMKFRFPNKRLLFFAKPGVLVKQIGAFYLVGKTTATGRHIIAPF